MLLFAILQVVIILLQDEIILNSIDANEPDVADYHYLPDIAALSSRLRSCLQVIF